MQETKKPKRTKASIEKKKKFTWISAAMSTNLAQDLDIDFNSQREVFFIGML